MTPVPPARIISLRLSKLRRNCLCSRALAPRYRRTALRIHCVEPILRLTTRNAHGILRMDKIGSMNYPTWEEQRRIVRQWEVTGRELERIRREKLRGMEYDWKDVDALLELGDHYDGPPRLTSGLVEMQRMFMKAARRSGNLEVEREIKNKCSVYRLHFGQVSLLLRFSQ